MPLTVKYTQKHPSGRIEYRRSIPPGLRAFVSKGNREHKVSLGRESDVGFLARYQHAADAYARLINEATKRKDGRFDTLDPPLVRFLADNFTHVSLSLDLAARDGAELPDCPFHPRNDPQGDWETSRELLEPFHQRDGLVAYWGDWATDYAAEMGYVLDRHGAALGDLCAAIAQEAARMYVNHYQVRLDVEHEHGGRRTDTPPKPLKPGKGDVVAKGSSLPLMALFDDYTAARKPSPGVQKEWRANVAQLVRFVGHDDAALLTSTDLRQWRDELLLQKRGGCPARSPRTVGEKYIRPVRTVLGWAVFEGRLNANVATAVKVDAPKPVRLRDPSFTETEAARILTASLAGPPAKLSAGYARAIRWAPWLMAFSGARVNEIGQLRAEDIREIDGIWTMRVTPDAGRVKNKRAREIPLHRQVIDQGFLAVVAEVSAGPLFYDPTQALTAGPGARHFKKVSERLSKWVRETVGISDTGLMPNHAWRHRFKSLSYEWGMEERLVDAIQGHAPATVARAYGEVSLKAKAAAIGSIPDFDLNC